MGKSNLIVVNAVAATHSGALSVLSNFINIAAKTDLSFLIFTGINFESYNQSNIKILFKENKKNFNRILWDYFHLNKEFFGFTKIFIKN